MRLIARPTSPFRFRFSLLVDGRPVGRVEHRLFGRPGSLDVGETSYAIRRVGPASYEAFEPVAGSSAARIEPTGALRHSYEVSWAAGSMVAARRGLGYGMRFIEAGSEVGRLRLRTLFTRTLVVEVPDHVPLEAVALVIYTAVRMRRRAIPLSGGA